MKLSLLLSTLALALASGCAKPHTYYIDGECTPPTTPTVGSYNDMRTLVNNEHKLVFNSGTPSELAACLTSPHHLEDTVVTKLYRTTVLVVEPGDALSASFSAELTSELPVEAFVAYYIEIKHINSGEVVYTSQRHGTNLLPLVHHITLPDSVYYEFEDFGDFEISVYAYSATGNDEIDIQNSHLTVEAGYGSLTGMVIR